MNIIEIKKELYKKNPIAVFKNYEKGILWYQINFLEGKFLIPIDLTEEVLHEEPVKTFYHDSIQITTKFVSKGIKLADDTKGCLFLSEMPAQHLIRWIERAILNNDFIDLGPVKLKHEDEFGLNDLKN